ncbi:Hyphally-regulated cell wall protein [Scheffersomyces xylosifermentans]|uniref:Hyphally-regulated cell wall protein n=1 Tax=Scheffersomyces xylosifermentans TaxID=1304137 RepID=UPI00315D55FD
MKFLSISASVLLASSTVLATFSNLDIWSPKISRDTINLNYGKIEIHAGAFWSIWNNDVTALKGNLQVDQNAGFYISGKDGFFGLSVTLASGCGSITNNGIIAFNSFRTLKPPTYNLIGISFTNNGEIYFGTNSRVGLPFVSITAPSWTNNGLIVIWDQCRGSGIVSLGAPLKTITNNGQICLHNELYKQTSYIQGSGCITADKDTSIFLSNLVLGIDSKQTFYLADSESSIRANALGKPQTITVAGFGNGNIIGLDIPIVSCSSKNAWDYDSKTGSSDIWT